MTDAPYLFICHGDLTRLRADALIYSTSTAQGRSGDQWRAFELHVPGFAAEYRAMGKTLTAQGDAVWVPCGRAEDAARQCHGVVAVATHHGKVTTDHVRSATANALACAAKVLKAGNREKSGWRPKWLIGMPALGTGTGEAIDHHGALAKAQLEAVLAFQEDHREFDVVVVGYRASSYDRFRAAHRKVAKRAPAKTVSGSTNPWSTLKAAIREGACVPFVGAGLSVPSGLLPWKDLIKALEKHCGITDARGDDLVARAQRCVVETSEDVVIQFIGDRFAEAKSGPQPFVPNLAHYLLAQVGFDEVVTTNYDHLLEHTYEALRLTPKRVIEEQDVAGSGSRSAVDIVKLHGCAGVRGDADRPPRDIVLTTSHYKDFDATYPAKRALVSALLLNNHFLFLGYSLSDGNVLRILERIRELLGPTQRRAYVAVVDDEIPESVQNIPRVEVIRFAGSNIGERARNMWIWLDGLTSGAHDTRLGLLASAEPKNDALAKLHRTLSTAARLAEDLHDREWTSDCGQARYPRGRRAHWLMAIG